MATIIFHDGSQSEIPDDNLANTERLLGHKIKEIIYAANPISDAVNELAKKQAAMWKKPPEAKPTPKAPQKKKQTGRPKGAKNK